MSGRVEDERQTTDDGHTTGNGKKTEPVIAIAKYRCFALIFLTVPVILFPELLVAKNYGNTAP